MQPAVLPVYCNALTETVDFIELFNFNLDILLQINGDADLLPFISNGDFVNDFIPEFRAVSLLGLQPGIREFFIEGISTCGTQNLSFRIEVFAPAAPVRIDTSLCFGDTLEVAGVKLFGGIPDTILIDGGACDTLLIASVALREPGRMPGGLFFPTPSSTIPGVALTGNGMPTECGEIVYLYDTTFAGQRGVLAIGRVGEDPPLGPNYDTVFTADVIDYNVPFLQASNGCDTFVNLNLEIALPILTELPITLCEGDSITLNIEGEDQIITTESTQQLTFENSGVCALELVKTRRSLGSFLTKVIRQRPSWFLMEVPMVVIPLLM